MQYAISMRYGGFMVDAQECDYTAFLNNGLLCPICKGTVYLIGASHRPQHNRKLKTGVTVEVRKTDVVAHFAHHSTDTAAVAACELRSTKLTVQQRVHADSVARGQISRMFRQKFYGMLRTSLKFTGLEAVNVLVEDLWLRASIYQANTARAMLQLLIEEIAKFASRDATLIKRKTTLASGLDKWVERLKNNPETVPPQHKDAFDKWTNVLDRRMQTRIVEQALDYVTHKAQQPILHELVYMGLYAFITAEAAVQLYKLDDDIHAKVDIYNQFMAQTIDADGFDAACVKVTRQLIGMSDDAFALICEFVMDDIIQMLVFVDWAEQFDKLERN